jgi:uncharacterized membrane protein
VVKKQKGDFSSEKITRVSKFLFMINEHNWPIYIFYTKFQRNNLYYFEVI